MRHASSRLSASMSLSSPTGASTSMATLCPVLPRFHATLRARERIRWICRIVFGLSPCPRPQLKALLERCPELQAVSGHVRTFARMLTQLTGQNLPQWISDVRAAELPGMSSFAKGLEQDLDAVTHGLTSHWNSGPVEGRINHIILWNLSVKARR
jgi:hypothetical protein